MPESYVEADLLAGLFRPQRIQRKRGLASFELEITARCNNNCRHCYINLPADDKMALREELSLSQIKGIIEQAASLGVLWCTVTGGEPLLRNDFPEIYLFLKKKGFLISLFTNATAISKEHINLFKKYPPRDIEVTVYGISKGTYERVSRIAGSFDAFMCGIDILRRHQFRVLFKTMVLRSNVNELSKIAKFCRSISRHPFRFDPFLYMRYDRCSRRNAEIAAERLLPEEIAKIEKSDAERFREMKRNCNTLITYQRALSNSRRIFLCGSGNAGFSISYNGYFRLCLELWHPRCVYDLKKGTLAEAWYKFVPVVREMCSSRKEFLEKCRRCPIINLCMWCPAHSYLETGNMDEPVDYFCDVAKARYEILKRQKGLLDMVLPHTQQSC